METLDRDHLREPDSDTRAQRVRLSQVIAVERDWLESKAEEALSHSTIDHLRWWDLSQIFKMAAAEGCISRSPATLLFTPRAARTPPQQRMSLQEVNLCFEVLDQRERLVAMLALTASMRLGEILALQWKHIQPDYIGRPARLPTTDRYPQDQALGPQRGAVSGAESGPRILERSRPYRTVRMPGCSRPSMVGRP